MSRENVEVVRRLFETYSRGDYAAAAVREMWERWDSAWEEFETVPEEFVDADVNTVRGGKCARKLEA
jgi:ketosteroid isomerase-like protein